MEKPEVEEYEAKEHETEEHEKMEYGNGKERQEFGSKSIGF